MTAIAGIVDAHIHFWKLDRGDYTALTPEMGPLLADHLPETLAPHLAAAGVDGIVVVQAAETLAETDYLLGLAEATPFILGIVGWLDPRDEGAGATVTRGAGQPALKGYRPVVDDNVSIAWLADPACGPGLEAMARHGAVLDILVQNPDELPFALDVARRHPDLTIVLDHCGKPDIAGGRFDEWARDIEGLARVGHVRCKLSGLLNRAAPGAGAKAVRPYADHVLASFGAGRVLWASDWPPLTLAGSYARWWEITDALLSGASADERAAILGGTARTTYGL
ncbi:MAG: amidohydrolase family protein [Azospirillaceae bacterium]